MMIIDQEGSGLVFDNSEYKERNPNSPDFTGVANIGGEQYRVAMWEKEFKNGFGFSLSIQPAEGAFSDDDEDEDEEPTPRRSSVAKKSAPRKTASRSSVKKSAPFKKPRR